MKGYYYSFTPDTSYFYGATLAGMEFQKEICLDCKKEKEFYKCKQYMRDGTVRAMKYFTTLKDVISLLNDGMCIIE